MALCEHEELASLTHTKPKTAPAHVLDGRKQEQAASGLKTNHTGQTVNTPNKKPKASPEQAAAAAPSSSKKGHAADRFIPNRSNMDMAHARFFSILTVPRMQLGPQLTSRPMTVMSVLEIRVGPQLEAVAALSQRTRSD